MTVLLVMESLPKNHQLRAFERMYVTYLKSKCSPRGFILEEDVCVKKGYYMRLGANYARKALQIFATIWLKAARHFKRNVFLGKLGKREWKSVSSSTTSFVSR